MNVLAAVPVVVEFRGMVQVPAPGGRLNLSGPEGGQVRACSRHLLRTVGPDGCPGCWLERLGRVAA